MSEEATSPVIDREPIVTIKEVGSTQERKAFLAAFAKAQGAFQPIVKNRSVTMRAKNKFDAVIEIKFRYADLQEIQNKTRPALAANGLSTSGPILPQEGGTWLSYVLAHAEGYERHSEMFIPYNPDEKKYAITVSYYRRYMASAMLDIAADDDLDEDAGDGGDDGAAPPTAPAPRTPARRTPAAKQSAAPGPADEPPIPPVDESELASRAAARTTGAAEARERVTGSVEAEVQRQMNGAENPSAGKPEEEKETVSSGETLGSDDGELAEPGERAFLVKRAKSRGGEELMPKVLAELGLQRINALTLEGITKTMWQRIKDKV